MGKITSELLQKLAPSTPKAKRDRFLPYFNEVLPRYNITNKKRVCSYMATVIMESDYLKATEEYASGKDYDITVNKKKAIDLGNTEPGDGVKYKGRTLIQTTGKDNYQRVSDKTGEDFVANPKKLAEPRWAVEGACIYWKDNKLNSYADKGDFFAVQGLVNRGSATKKAKDYAKREAIYNLAMSILPNDFKLDSTESLPNATEDKKESTPENQTITVENADSVKINEAGSTPEGDNVKVTVTDGNVEVETNASNAPKEKVAVVAAKPQGAFSRLYAKVIAAITGSPLVIWLTDQVGKLSGIILSPVAWQALIILVVVCAIIWIVWEMLKVRQEKKIQAELDKLLVEQNSTPTNTVQIIPADEVELYRARKYKIISRGESVPQPTEVKEDK